MNRFYARIVLLSVFCALTFSVSASSWLSVAYDPFKELIGVSEQQFFNEYGFSDAGKEFLKAKLQGKQGKFYLKQVEPFDVQFFSEHKKEKMNFVRGITFSVIEGGENPSETFFQKYLDVAALQALPENNGALFQVASNLNALELNGTKKERIYTYVPLRTQGEICALSALPGIIDRMYLQLPINFLKNFNWHGPIMYMEGYFPFMSGMHTRFKDMTYDDIVQTCSTVSVGVQKNVCVTSGLRDYSSDQFKAVPVQGIDQCITQVFTAALDPYNNRALAKTFGFENLARTLLHGAYKGTFDVAYEMGTKKIFLTLVGGGVFQNKFEWITEALSVAFRDFSYKKDPGFWGRHEGADIPVDVTLILYHIPAHQKRTKDWLCAEKTLKKLVEISKGSWIRYTSFGSQKIGG